MGGMQVLEWGYFPFVKHLVPIATSGRHSAWCISWGEAQRQSIYSDPKYCNGNYERFDPPISGLSAARMAALLTYRSRNSFESRFGRNVVPKKNIERLGSSKSELYHNEGNKLRMHAEGNTIAIERHREREIYQEKSGKSLETISASNVTSNEFSVYSAQSYLRYQGDKFIQR